MSDNELFDDLDKLFNETAHLPLGEGEFTCRIVAERKRITIHAAQSWLNRQLEAGLIVRVGKRNIGGHPAWAYAVAPAPPLTPPHFGKNGEGKKEAMKK